jgi:hypothetical protein
MVRYLVRARPAREEFLRELRPIPILVQGLAERSASVGINAHPPPPRHAGVTTRPSLVT